MCYSRSIRYLLTVVLVLTKFSVVSGAANLLSCFSCTVGFVFANCYI